MMIIARVFLTIYLLGFILVFVLHALFLQMVTFELALVRSAVWPIYLTTGRPYGTPLRMD